MCLMCELIRRLVPAVSRARIAASELVMLLGRRDQLAGHDERVEAEQPRLAPEAVDELGQAAVAELRDQLDVEAPIGIEVVDQVPAGRRGDDLVGDLVEPIEHLGRHDLDHVDRRRDLEHQTDLADLVEVRLRHLDHAEAAIALGDHEPVLGQREHRLAHRSRADAEPLAEQRRRIQLPGLELAGHQRRLERATNLIAEAPVMDDTDVARLDAGRGHAHSESLD